MLPAGNLNQTCVAPFIYTHMITCNIIPTLFFQDQLAGSLSSKLKGIWDGYNQFWSEMHHGLSQSVLRIIIGLIALSVVKVELVLCVLAWSILYVPLVYNMSLRLRTLSTAETESRHDLIRHG